MKIIKKTLLLAIIVLATACSKEESSTTTQTNTSTTNINTWAKLSVVTTTGVVKPNYIVMMYDQPFSPTAVMPPIIMQVTTDANGLACFDLNALITTTAPKRYYFEAFVQTSNGYTLKTNFSRFNVELSKGQMLTTSLLVN